MLDKFKSLKGSTKALIIVCGVMAVVATPNQYRLEYPLYG